MDPDRWRQIDRLMQQALDCEPSDRSSFLDKACGDDTELRQEVDSLLSSCEEACNFMENSPSETASELLAQHNPEWAVGQSVGAYEITGILGSGGMGEVYRARDARLGREVALKVLPPELAEDPQWLKRLEREARSASSMNHPNIVTIYEIGTSGSTRYIAMELVDGRTLRDILSSGPLSLEECLRIAGQLAVGLAKAHDAGIIHGDLKPENVMVAADGLVKILDFGLAIAVGPVPGTSSPASVSIRWAVFGTVGYMSPEQAADKSVDFRSDQFSLGAVLYEMATGRRAFKGTTPVETLASIIRDDPEPVQRLNPGLPAAFLQIVGCCLSKNPGDRYGSTQELARAVGEIGPATIQLKSGKKRSTSKSHPAILSPLFARRTFMLTAAAIIVGVAVWTLLYFVRSSRPALNFQAEEWVLVSRFDNRTGDSQLDGIVDYLLQRELGNSAYIRIVPPERIEDALRLMKKPLSTPVDSSLGKEICVRDGGIRALVTGRMDVMGSVYVVTADIVDPFRGIPVISEIRQVRGKDQLLPEIRLLSNRLRERFGEARAAIQKGQLALEKVTTPSFQAAKFFSQGMNAVNVRQWAQAEQLFKDALAEDPGFASAHAYLYWAMRNQLPGNRTHRFPDIDTDYGSHARRAFELANGVSEPEWYFIAGTYYRAADERRKACEAFKTLSDRHPDHYWAANNAQAICGELGDGQAALTYTLRKAEIRPNSFEDNHGAAQFLLEWRGDWSRAAQYADRAGKLLPEPGSAQYGFAQVRLEQLSMSMLWYQGDMAAAAKKMRAWAERMEGADRQEQQWYGGLIANWNLNLGRLRAAEESFSWTDNLEGGQAYSILWVAVAQRDQNKLRLYLGKYLDKIKRKEIDPGSAEWLPILLHNAGLDSETEVVLRPKPVGLAPQPETPKWRHVATLLEANRMVRQGYLAAGASVFDQLRSERVRLFDSRDYWTDTTFILESQLLAKTLDVAGDLSGAIHVLEEAVGDRQRFRRYIDCYLETRAMLAALYRRQGRVKEAQTAEAELLKLLAVADPDHPILVQIKASQNSTR